MMKIKSLIVLFLLSAAIAGCEMETEPDSSIGLLKNFPPGPFKVSVLTTSYNYAVIVWEPAVDPNNDTLFYTVYFNDSIIAINLKTDSILRIENLKPETEYQGKIEVTDKKSDAVVVPFSFKTKKYFLSFNKLYPDFTGGASIELTPDGGYVIGSSIYDREKDTHGAVIIKLDSLGYVQWTTKCMNRYSIDTQVKPTNDNGYILVDNANIIKLNHLGKEIWRYPSDQSTYKGSSIIQTADNNFLIAGTRSNKAFISKFNFNGDLIWEKFYESSRNTSAKYIEKSSDGNYVLIGNESSDSNQNLFVLKIDGDGNLLWKKTYTYVNSAFAHQIKNTSDNGYIICAGSYNIQSVSSARILKIDHEGNTQWDKSFLWDIFKTYGFSIVQVPDGGYVFSGCNGYSPKKGLLAKLDSEGELVWKKEFKPDYMDYAWILHNLKLTKDGGLIMLGNKGSIWGYGVKEVGMWLMKSEI